MSVTQRYVLTRNEDKEAHSVNKHEDPVTNPQCLQKKLVIAVHVCNPSIGSPWRDYQILGAQWSGRLYKMVSTRFSKRPCFKLRWRGNWGRYHPLSSTWVCRISTSAYTYRYAFRRHAHTQIHTHAHNFKSTHVHAH